MPFPSPFLIGGMAQVPLTFRGPAGALLQEGAQRGLMAMVSVVQVLVCLRRDAVDIMKVGNTVREGRGGE